MSTSKSDAWGAGDKPSTKGKGTTISFLNDFQGILHNILYKNSNPTVNVVFEQVEQRIPLKREQVTYVIIGLFTVYLVFGAFAELLCNFIGFAYPAYASVKAIRSSNKDDDTRWLIYWTAFAAFTLVDFFADFVFHYFPFYWLFKVFFMLYLYLPQTCGALLIYNRFVDPAISKIDDYLTGYMNKAEKKE